MSFFGRVWDVASQMAHNGARTTDPSPHQFRQTNPHDQAGEHQYVMTELQALDEMRARLQSTLNQLSIGVKGIDKFSEDLEAVIQRAAHALLQVRSNYVVDEPSQKQTRVATGLFYGQGVGGSGVSSTEGQMQEEDARESGEDWKHELGRDRQVMLIGQEPNSQMGLDPFSAVLEDMKKQLVGSLEEMKTEWGDLLGIVEVTEGFNETFTQHHVMSAKKNVQGGNYQHEIRRKEEFWRQKHETVKMELANMNEQVQNLKDKLRQVEQENRKARGGSHMDSGALPPWLEEAATAVKTRLENFAKAVSGFANRLDLPRDERHAIAIDSMEFENKKHRMKYRAAYVISTIMFRGFEIDGFDSTKGYFCPSSDPEDSASACFKEFQSMEHQSSDPSFLPQVEEVVKANAPADEDAFQQFVCQKFRDVIPDELRKEACEPPILRKFVLLGIAVWKLQRLALSFHPNAKIFRVRCGAELDERYMVKIADNDPETAPPKVGFMVVPGFRLGKIIVKSQVYPQRRGRSEDQ